MKILDLVGNGVIVPALKAADRDAAIEEMVDALVAAGAAAKALRDDLIKHILDREKKGSTGFGKGVAVPHVKHEKIKKMGCAIGISKQGVDFNALDKAPVFSIILLLSPLDRPNEHLEAMQVIFTKLREDHFRRFLRNANSVEEIKDLLAEADGQ